MTQTTESTESGSVNYLDLTGYDKNDPSLSNRQHQTMVIREVVKRLIASHGKPVYIRDDHWVLGKFFPKLKISSVLVVRVEQALEAMFEKRIPVGVTMIVGKTESGVGWRVAAPTLTDALAAGGV